jgi:ubiquinone/menaquinone biosynthesis C-methylase UbiE
VTLHRRRIAVAAGLATVAWLAQPALRRVTQSIRTSSAPGATAYERAAGLALGGHYRDVAADCAAVLAGVDAPAILEVGPGPGHLAEHLLDRLPTATWTGLDVDPAMLRASARRLDGAGTLARATLIEGDVASMPFADVSFDLVVSSFSAHHWPDAQGGFAEIRRVLRPDGRALVYDLSPRLGHLETGHAGLRAAGAVFGPHECTRHRGIGPLTIVWRAVLRP